MTPTIRYLRFNLVGLLGVLLQLSLLALLNHLLHHRYLLATTLALELTLLHNYAWHRRFTWPDRPATLRTLARFHLTNGALSLAGNLLLMHVLVANLHLHPVPANAFAILACSILNYTAAHTWAFSAAEPS